MLIFHLVCFFTNCADAKTVFLLRSRALHEVYPAPLLLFLSSGAVSYFHLLFVSPLLDGTLQHDNQLKLARIAKSSINKRPDFDSPANDTKFVIRRLQSTDRTPPIRLQSPFSLLSSIGSQNVTKTVEFRRMGWVSVPDSIKPHSAPVPAFRCPHPAQPRVTNQYNEDQRGSWYSFKKPSLRQACDG